MGNEKFEVIVNGGYLVVRGKHKGNMYENKVFRDLKKIDDETTRKTIGSGSAKDEGGDIIFKNYIIDTKHCKRMSKTELNAALDKIYIDAKKFLSKSFEPVLIYKEGSKNSRRDAIVMYDLARGNVRVMEFYDDWYVRMKEKYTP